MKKLFVMAFMAVSIVALAQHVTPLDIQIADLKLDSLRTLYQAEPEMYRASLTVVEKQLAKNAEDIKAAKSELKAEQNHAKDLDKTLKEATKLIANLKKVYEKEESELKNMQKTVEKQQRSLGKSSSLNQESKDSYQQILEARQKELGYAIRDVADRKHTIADTETALQNSQTNLQTFVQETIQKAQDLTLLETTYKQRAATLKAEQKAAKAMQ